MSLFTGMIVVRTEDDIKTGIAHSQSNTASSREQVDSFGTQLYTHFFRLRQPIKKHHFLH
jgi:hypothetical protein